MKVKLLFGKYISAPTGASAVMRYLKSGVDIFKKLDVEINFYTRDDIIPPKNNNTEFKERSVSGLKRIVMSVLEKASKYSAPAAILHRYLLTGRASKILIDKYNLGKKDDSDIVFFHELDTCYYYLKSRGYDPKKKIVLVSHDNGITHEMILIKYPIIKNSIFYRCLLKKSRFVFNHIDKLGFVSETSKNTFIKNNPNFPKEKLFHCINGLPDIGCVGKLENKDKNSITNICCVGTICERKGQRNIIEAFLKLTDKEKSKIHINLIGDGELREELEKLCIDNNISENVTFWGSRKDIDKLLAQNDIFLLPSKNEGLPIAILEAMRQGLPIVATNVGGIPETIVNGFTGVLIQPDIQSLLQLFQEIEEYDWRKMGEESKILFNKKFSLESMICKYSTVFHELMDRL